MEEGEEDDHEGPGPITSRRLWQPGTLMNKISRTVRGGKEVARKSAKDVEPSMMMKYLKKKQDFNGRKSTQIFTVFCSKILFHSVLPEFISHKWKKY
jgi:hypothetical protein